MEFKQGQQVSWTSQSAGIVKTKTGTVEQVVPAGGYPDRERFEALYRGPGVGLHRDHQSYVVRVPGKTAKAAGKLYWPRVTHLKAAA
jgi:hypothetical protein